MSQHQRSIDLYHRLSGRKLACSPTMGLDHIEILAGGSPGCGGATLLLGVVNDQKVIIKVFPVDCPYKYLRGIQKCNGDIRDYGNFELGTGLLFTELFVLTNLSQNITTCFNMQLCQQAYSTDLSVCTKQPVAHQDTYLIPPLSQCQDDNHPLCSFARCYFQPNLTTQIEIPARSDEVRLMMVERLDGDMLGLLEKFISEGLELAEIERLLHRMLVMIFHTLILFDTYLDGYSHNDLGLRNVLYAVDDSGNLETYWRYLIPSQGALIAVDIPTVTPIPKIWDFAFVLFGSADQYQNYYSYLSSAECPSTEQLSGTNRVNDVYVLLNDLQVQLKAVGIVNGLYSQLDLSAIEKAVNNTAAIYQYFAQVPLNEDILAADHHRIVHQFPSDTSVFVKFPLQRQVFDLP